VGGGVRAEPRKVGGRGLERNGFTNSELKRFVIEESKRLTRRIGQTEDQ